MDGKECFKCKVVKPLYEFYPHPAMGDGHLGKCKKCAREDVRNNRRKKLDYYRAYDAERFQRPERRRQHFESAKRHRARYPDHYKARMAVSNALKYGKIIRQPCRVCGDPVSEAHHHDYSKPLDVTWPCFKHHREHHQQAAA